jgi:hypothetical protein
MAAPAGLVTLCKLGIQAGPIGVVSYGKDRASNIVEEFGRSFITCPGTISYVARTNQNLFRSKRLFTGCVARTNQLPKVLFIDIVAKNTQS